MKNVMRQVKLLFLILMLAISATTSAQTPQWPNASIGQVVPARTAGLVHGPMLGRPASDSVRIWVRTDKPKAFEIRYDTSLPLDADSPSVKGKTDASRDNIGLIDLTGLSPHQTYYYGVVIDGKLADTRVAFKDPWPSFRTLPDHTTSRDPDNNPDGLFNLTFSVSVCGSQDPNKSGGQYTDPPGWDTLHQKFGDKVMFHIKNGDYTYEEGRNGTLDGLRGNYRLYMDRSPGMARFQRSVPWMYMYDDHEVGDNLFGAGQVGFKRKGSRHINRDIQLKAWHDYAGWTNPDSPHRGPLVFGTATVKKGGDIIESKDIDFSALKPDQVSTILVGKKGRKTNAPSASNNAGTYGLVKVLDKHRIQVTPAFAQDEAIGFSIGTHHYYDKQIGNCHFFAIDTRGERSTFNVKNLKDEKTFLLGETQRKWLIDGIKKTDADFIFIVSSVGVVVPHSIFHVKPEAGDRSKGDGFPGFVHERELILAELDKIEKPIMFFTGDVHSSVSAQITNNIWEFMVSPFNSNGHPIGTLGNMPYSGWYNAEGRWARIKWVASAPNNVHYSRLRKSYFAVVRVNNLFTAPRPDGETEPGHQFIPYPHPQVIVTWYDGFTGEPVYSEAVSTLDLEEAPAR